MIHTSIKRWDLTSQKKRFDPDAAFILFGTYYSYFLYWPNLYPVPFPFFKEVTFAQVRVQQTHALPLNPTFSLPHFLKYLLSRFLHDEYYNKNAWFWHAMNKNLGFREGDWVCCAHTRADDTFWWRGAVYKKNESGACVCVYFRNMVDFHVWIYSCLLQSFLAWILPHFFPWKLTTTIRT